MARPEPEPTTPDPDTRSRWSEAEEAAEAVSRERTTPALPVVAAALAESFGRSADPHEVLSVACAMYGVRVGDVRCGRFRPAEKCARAAASFVMLRVMRMSGPDAAEVLGTTHQTVFAAGRRGENAIIERVTMNLNKRELREHLQATHGGTALLTQCPKCGAKTGVMDSRPTTHGFRRRRKCPKCQYRYTTIEIVAKADGAEPVPPAVQAFVDLSAKFSAAERREIARLIGESLPADPDPAAQTASESVESATVATDAGV